MQWRACVAINTMLFCTPWAQSRCMLVCAHSRRANGLSEWSDIRTKRHLLCARKSFRSAQLCVLKPRTRFFGDILREAAGLTAGRARSGAGDAAEQCFWARAMVLPHRCSRPDFRCLKEATSQAQRCTRLPGRMLARARGLAATTCRSAHNIARKSSVDTARPGGILGHRSG